MDFLLVEVVLPIGGDCILFFFLSATEGAFSCLSLGTTTLWALACFLVFRIYGGAYCTLYHSAAIGLMAVGTPLSHPGLDQGFAQYNTVGLELDVVVYGLASPLALSSPIRLQAPTTVSPHLGSSVDSGDIRLTNDTTNGG